MNEITVRDVISIVALKLSAAILTSATHTILRSKSLNER